MDFELTSDGDLLLGQQKTDEKGNLLYFLNDPLGLDFPIETTNPENATITIRDFKKIDGDLERIQLIETRLKTENPDWITYRNVGASLTDFIGLQNTPDNGELIRQRVFHTLVRDEAYTEEELKVNVVPISATEILIDIIMENNDLYTRYAFSLNYEIGITNVYVLDKNGEVLEEPKKVNPDMFEGIVYDETEDLNDAELGEEPEVEIEDNFETPWQPEDEEDANIEID